MLKEYILSDRLFMPTSNAYYACTLDAVKDLYINGPHRQTFYSIVWFVQGEGYKIIDFSEYRIRSGRIFLVNPDQISNCSYSNRCKGYVLMFTRDLALQLCIDFSKPYIDIEKSEGSLLRLVFQNLIKNCQSDEDDSQNKIKTSIQYFYSQIEDKIHKGTLSSENKNPIFRQFKELILANDHNVQSVEQYADTLHITKIYLNAMCRDFKGITAKQFLLDSKMIEAKRLLIYSGLHINEISFQLGFDDASYFARIFRKKTRLSPRRFQEKYRK
jgi:AraC-like DNA-binding protein